jgi:hypothetical protein
MGFAHLGRFALRQELNSTQERGYDHNGKILPFLEDVK